MHLAVGQPIVAVAGFQPATRGCEGLAHDAKRPPKKAAAGRIARPTKQARLRPHCTSAVTAWFLSWPREEHVARGRGMPRPYKGAV